MDYEKAIKLCETIQDDMRNDAENFDGKPFTGHTVGTALGNHGAAIAALAMLIRDLVKTKIEVK